MPQTAPQGTITFLFTDIQGSTVLWQGHHDAMVRALARHDELLCSLIEARSGYVFKTVGDAFCAAFDDPCDALQVAIEIQRGLEAVDWPSFGPGFPDLLVRAGIHTGTAELRDGDYFGSTLSRVARLSAAAEGGQVVLSLVTQRIVRERIPPEVRLIDLGEVRLKDLVHTERVFTVVAPGMAEFAPSEKLAQGVDPREKVIADHEAAERSLPEATQLLLDAVRSDGQPIALRPEQLREVAELKPTDLTAFRLGRVAEWSRPRYRLDDRFVDLALIVDRGEAARGTRWEETGDRYDDLRRVLEAVSSQAMVVLGPPGSGKSTLLRRFELDAALDGLRGSDGSDAVTFFVPLSRYAPERPGDAPPGPAEWLEDRWRVRYPDLPALDDLAAEGRVVLLLDALNEVPTASEAEFHEVVRVWKDFLHRVIERSPGNRVVFSCRGLDYSAPLSSPQLRVPQVRVMPLSDEQVRAFLKAYGPLHYREVWAELDGSPQLEMLRSPYFLKLLVQQVEAEGRVPAGRASLFTSFVRQALQREVERDNVLFRPDTLLSRRDVRRVVGGRWRSPTDLPERGALIERLSALAFEMQSTRFEGEAAQVRVSYDDALDLIDHDMDEEILAGGLALSLLDEDTVTDEVRYVHQLVQEYMAARVLAAQPEEAPQLALSQWRAEEVTPALDEVVRALAPADPLPRLPTSGWEETVLLAAAMTPDPESFVERLGETNLELAGRCASQPDVDLPEELADSVRRQLEARSRHLDADLRARVAAAETLGHLGDPRLTSGDGGHGSFLVPEMVRFAAGEYRIGRRDDAGDESPEHGVDLAEFSIARMPVTNAEWRLFMTSGGYEDEKWWDTDGGADWRRGVGTAHGLRTAMRYWTDKLRSEPGILESRYEAGHYSDELYEMWLRRTKMDDETLEEHLAEEFPSGRKTEPRFWRDSAFNGAAQPVVGICWYEARAYCNWLSEQTGQSYRLPSEAEWEAAARGVECRAYAFAGEFDPRSANSQETHMRRPAPVGVFPRGDTPEGLSDMTGNTWDWTSSLYGRRPADADFRYPYEADDGREDPNAGPDVNRVARGGSWFNSAEEVRPTTRYSCYPDMRLSTTGVRLAI